MENVYKATVNKYEKLSLENFIQSTGEISNSIPNASC